METVSMSYEELDRVRVIERVIEKRLTQREAARMLGLTSRQVRRLHRAYERDGAGSLASKHRGRPSNRRLPAALRPGGAHHRPLPVRGFRPDAGPREVDGVARLGVLGRDAPALDGRGRALDPPSSPSAADSAAPAPQAVSRRAHPDRWLRSPTSRRCAPTWSSTASPWSRDLVQPER